MSLVDQPQGKLNVSDHVEIYHAQISPFVKVGVGLVLGVEERKHA